MKDSWIGQVGIWGQRHYQYLKENKPTAVNVMRMNGNLKSHLREVDEQAEEMLFQLVKQMAKDEGVDEAMKRRDQLYWVGRMNNIRNRAEETVLREVIYV
ncbi:MAG: TnpV protein [Clostridia bacterium]|nr:TnpV protein [Clostridia bacterium]